MFAKSVKKSHRKSGAHWFLSHRVKEPHTIHPVSIFREMLSADSNNISMTNASLFYFSLNSTSRLLRQAIPQHNRLWVLSPLIQRCCCPRDSYRPFSQGPTTEINVVSSDSRCVAHGFSWPQRRTVRGRVAVTSSRYPREQLGVWHTTVNNPMIPYKCLLSGKINFNERLKSILSLLHSVHPGLS